jgi:hypothetical protein
MNQLREVGSDAPEFELLKMAVRMPDALSTKTPIWKRTSGKLFWKL